MVLCKLVYAHLEYCVQYQSPYLKKYNVEGSEEVNDDERNKTDNDNIKHTEGEE